MRSSATWDSTTRASRGVTDGSVHSFFSESRASLGYRKLIGKRCRPPTVSLTLLPPTAAPMNSEHCPPLHVAIQRRLLDLVASAMTELAPPPLSASRIVRNFSPGSLASRAAAP